MIDFCPRQDPREPLGLIGPRWGKAPAPVRAGGTGDAGSAGSRVSGGTIRAGLAPELARFTDIGAGPSGKPVAATAKGGVRPTANTSNPLLQVRRVRHDDDRASLRSTHDSELDRPHLSPYVKTALRLLSNYGEPPDLRPRFYGGGYGKHTRASLYGVAHLDG